MMRDVCSGKMDDQETDHCFGIVGVYTCKKFGRFGFKNFR